MRFLSFDRRTEHSFLAQSKVEIEQRRFYFASPVIGPENLSYLLDRSEGKIKTNRDLFTCVQGILLDFSLLPRDFFPFVLNGPSE